MNPDKKPTHMIIQYTIKLPTIHPARVAPKVDIDKVLVEATLQGMTERGSFPDVKKYLDNLVAK